MTIYYLNVILGVILRLLRDQYFRCRFCCISRIGQLHHSLSILHLGLRSLCGLVKIHVLASVTRSLLVATIREVINIASIIIMNLAGQLTGTVLIILSIVVSIISNLVPSLLTLIHQLDRSIIKMVLLLQMVANTLLIYQILALGARGILDLTTQT